MGDHADDALDECIEDWAHETVEIQNQLRVTSGELVAFTAGARLPLIIGIRKHYEKYGTLSPRQRWCLARWVVEHDRGEE